MKVAASRWHIFNVCKCTKNSILSVSQKATLLFWKIRNKHANDIKYLVPFLSYFELDIPSPHPLSLYARERHKYPATHFLIYHKFGRTKWYLNKDRNVILSRYKALNCATKQHQSPFTLIVHQLKFIRFWKSTSQMWQYKYKRSWLFILNEFLFLALILPSFVHFLHLSAMQKKGRSVSG